MPTPLQYPTCDQCRQSLVAEQTVIEIGAYGLKLHQNCFLGLSSGQMVKLLGIDETLAYQLTPIDGEVPDTQHRIRDAGKITADGYPKSEPVQWH